MATALLVLDYINDIIHPDGKLAGKGYAAFAEQHNTLLNVQQAISHARNQGWPNRLRPSRFLGGL
jgi:nicotinamidase-related amidase